MPLATLAELNQIARREPRGSHDSYSESALERAVDEYLDGRRARIAPIMVEVDGKPFPTILHALLDGTTTFERVRLTVDHPPTAGTVWEFVPPLQALEVAADGSATVQRPGAASPEPDRSIARLILRDHYHPRSAHDDNATGPVAAAVRPGLITWPEFAEFVRSTGIVPFSAAQLTYGEEGRARFELDLVDSQLLPDIRAGRLPLARRVRRSSRLAHGVDQYVAREEPGVLASHALEVLFETNGLPAIDLAHVLGGVRELVTSTLEGLRARGLVAFDRRTGIYRCRPDAFLTADERARMLDEPLAPLPNPALRTSVMELLAAADSRATCPLCGDPLLPSHRGILCERCAREVDATPDAST
ncbi:MAG: hypothetical protein L3K23_04840 [Thermoplasmata archaeon]|nr:hypothetical protein [Thermoplasmata archaeon]